LDFRQKRYFSSSTQAFDSILKLRLNVENKTYVGQCDNVVPLIKAHSLHTLFAVFEKNRNFTIYYLIFELGPT
jgi:hypothetical protein